MAKQFEAPIPGESLTGNPKKYPWERPPEISDPKEALGMHMARLAKPDVMDGTLAMLEAGVPLKDLTLGILRVAVSEGYHSPDISLMVAPAMHEYIKRTADEVGIEYDEGLVDEKAEASASRAKASMTASSQLKKKLKELPEEVKEEAPVEEMIEETPKQGLMTRRT